MERKRHHRIGSEDPSEFAGTHTDTRFRDEEGAGRRRRGSAGMGRDNLFFVFVVEILHHMIPFLIFILLSSCIHFHHSTILGTKEGDCVSEIRRK